jgi:hypothetical protein
LAEDGEAADGRARAGSDAAIGANRGERDKRKFISGSRAARRHSSLPAQGPADDGGRNGPRVKLDRAMARRLLLTRVKLGIAATDARQFAPTPQGLASRPSAARPE